MKYQLNTRTGRLCEIVVPCREVGVALEQVAKAKTRIRVWYGDPDTGLAWNEFHDVKGTIGFSTGKKPAMLLKPRSTSSGGDIMLTHRIIRIDDIKTHKVLYINSNFHVNVEPNTYTKRDEFFLKGFIYG